MTVEKCFVLLLSVTLIFIADYCQGLLGDRCHQTSDCQPSSSSSSISSKSDTKIICRWMAKACGFGFCSCADNFVEHPPRSGLCVPLNRLSLELSSSTTTNQPTTKTRKQRTLPSALFMARRTTTTTMKTATIFAATGPRSPDIVHVNYGEACSQRRQCVAELTCLAGRCGCPSATRYVEARGSCEAIQPGDACLRNEDCFMAQNTICSSNNCTCLPGYREANVRFSKIGSGIGNEIRCILNDDTLLTDVGDYCGDAYPSGIHLNKLLCGDGLQCTTCGGLVNICTKIEDVPFVAEQNDVTTMIKSMTSVCLDDNDCPSTETMTCVRPLEACNASGGTCVCAVGFHVDPTDGVCKKAVSLGKPCKNQKTDICIDRNAECVNGQCQCGPNWQIGPGNQCVSNKARLFYGYACSINGTWDCHGNMVCSLIDGNTRCACPHGQRIDSENVHIVEFLQIDGSPGRYAERYICIENKIGDDCTGDSDCVLAPNSRCLNSKCSCNEGFAEKLASFHDGTAVTVCVSLNAPRGLENNTCGSQSGGVMRICNDGDICTYCGGSADRTMICITSRNATDGANGALIIYEDTPYQRSLNLHKISDICMNDGDCRTRNGDLVCSLVAPVCGHYGKCVCAPGFKEVFGGKCRPIIGQVCSGECATPRAKCQFGICQCDPANQINPQWHSLGARLHSGPIGSTLIDCTVWETQFYGDPCTDTSQCFRGLRCFNQTCVCPVGYKIKLPATDSSNDYYQYHCIPVEIGDTCNSDDDCRLVSNGNCNATLSQCDCQDGYKPVQYYSYNSDDIMQQQLVTIITKRCVPVNEEPREAKQRCDGADGAFCRPDHVCANCLFGNSARDSFCLPQFV